MSVAFIQWVSDSSNSALICGIINKLEPYVDGFYKKYGFIKDYLRIGKKKLTKLPIIPTK